MSSVDVRAASLRFRPQIGRAVPVTVVRLGIAAVLLALCFSILGFDRYLAFGILLAAATLVFPRTPAAWALAILLAVFALDGFQAAPGWRFFVMLAGAQALHQFGSMLAWLPVSGQIQLRILGRMLRSFLIVQVPAQVVSFAVLTLLSGASVVRTLTSPVFGLVAGLGLALMVVLVVVPLLRGSGTEPK